MEIDPVKFQYLIDNIDEIIPGLYGSACYAVEDEKKMKELGMTHILTVAKYVEPCFPDTIIYKCLPVEDTPRENLKPYFEECSDFIE